VLFFVALRTVSRRLPLVLLAATAAAVRFLAATAAAVLFRDFLAATAAAVLFRVCFRLNISPAAYIVLVAGATPTASAVSGVGAATVSLLQVETHRRPFQPEQHRRPF
jgi:hypothetical protein